MSENMTSHTCCGREGYQNFPALEFEGLNNPQTEEGDVPLAAKNISVLAERKLYLLVQNIFNGM